MSTSMRIFIVCTVLLNIAFVVKSESNADSIIETKDGKVRGVRGITLLKNHSYYEYKGIPYAKNPTGELRFKAPEPVLSWAPNILDAIEHGKMCTQPLHPLGDVSQQSEDCLFLNIYVPVDIKNDEKLAVLVHLHGGGYGQGSGNDDTLGPDFLLEQRVIVVTLNYRLGVFGFMSFGKPDYSGNMGLKDQQLALKWIHSNIEHFSGDNKRITLNGVSAGGSSTHFHVFSEESRKYFRNVIIMSGSIDNYWALSKKSDHLDFAHRIADELGEPKQSVEELITFFKSAPAAQLSQYGNITGFFRRLSQPALAPVIERRDAIRPFIVETPEKLYKSTNIDVDAMFSFTESEFISFYSKRSNEVFIFNDLNENFSIPLPFREANLTFDSPEYQSIAKEIKEFYFKDAIIDEKSLIQYLELLSDINFAHGVDKSARQHAKYTNSKTYYYRFSVDSKLNILKRILGNGGDIPGAGHGGDSCYLFRCRLFQPTYDDVLKNPNDTQSKISVRTIEELTKLFANFAKHGTLTHDGDPVAGFEPIQRDQVHFLDITNDGLIPGVNPNQAANDLWSGIEQRINAASQRTSYDEL